jgi:morphogenetic protein associated with SpoVID
LTKGRLTGLKVHVVQQGDTLWKISKQYGIPLESLIAANPQIPDPDKINVGMHVNVPVPKGDHHDATKYVVVSGDTLWKIAKKTGNSLASLIAANPQIANPDVLMPGQVINLPAPGSMYPPGMPIGPMTKEKMTMPKPTEVKPMEKEKVTMPKVLPPAPVPVMPSIEQHQFMVNYEPHYLMYEPHYIHMPKKVTAPKPAPVPVPGPTYLMSPCPPGTYPAIVDEYGCLHPYPMYVQVLPPGQMPLVKPPIAGMYPGVTGPAGLLPGMAPGVGMPGMAPGVGMPGMAPGVGMPGMAPGVGMPGMAPGVGMPGMAPGAAMPGMPPGAGMPGMPPGAGMPKMTRGEQAGETQK